MLLRQTGSNSADKRVTTLKIRTIVCDPTLTVRRSDPPYTSLTCSGSAVHEHLKTLFWRIAALAILRNLQPFHLDG